MSGYILTYLLTYLLAYLTVSQATIAPCIESMQLVVAQVAAKIVLCIQYLTGVFCMVIIAAAV